MKCLSTSYKRQANGECTGSLQNSGLIKNPLAFHRVIREFRIRVVSSTIRRARKEYGRYTVTEKAILERCELDSQLNLAEDLFPGEWR